MKQILVVDDEPSVLLGICRNLHGRRSEWEAVLAIDAEEACAKLDAASDIGVLVCDLAMPGGGGVKVLRHAMETCPHIVRIVLSGLGQSEITDEARHLCDRFLEKPCSADVLQEAIQWAFDRQHQK